MITTGRRMFIDISEKMFAHVYLKNIIDNSRDVGRCSGRCDWIVAENGNKEKEKKLDDILSNCINRSRNTFFVFLNNFLPS